MTIARERLRSLSPGLVWTSSVGVAAWLLAHAVPLFGAPVLAILLGLAVSLVRRPPPATAPGIAFSSSVLNFSSRSCCWVPASGWASCFGPASARSCSERSSG